MSAKFCYATKSSFHIPTHGTQVNVVVGPLGRVIDIRHQYLGPIQAGRAPTQQILLKHYDHGDWYVMHRPGEVETHVRHVYREAEGTHTYSFHDISDETAEKLGEALDKYRLESTNKVREALDWPKILRSAIEHASTFVELTAEDIRNTANSDDVVRNDHCVVGFDNDLKMKLVCAEYKEIPPQIERIQRLTFMHKETGVYLTRTGNYYEVYTSDLTDAIRFAQEHRKQAILSKNNSQMTKKSMLEALKQVDDDAVIEVIDSSGHMELTPQHIRFDGTGKLIIDITRG